MPNGSIIIPQDLGQVTQIVGQMAQTQQGHSVRIERLETVVRNSEQGKLALIVGVLLSIVNGIVGWAMLSSLNALKGMVN